MNLVFWRLWLGQWISNLGTQISFYGLGLWLLTSSGRFGSLAAVALVVQLARVSALPLLARHLPHWPKRQTLQIAYLAGGLVTAMLTSLLLFWGSRVPMAFVLCLLAIGAMAEAVLVLTFATLIPELVRPDQLGRANGVFASTDGFVYLLAPFLGALLSARLGLRGVVMIDVVSFVLALLLVSVGRWPAISELHLNDVRMHGLRLAWRGLRQSPRLWALLLLGMALMVGFAAAELLFPAWVVSALGSQRLSTAVLLSALAYALGTGLWQSIAKRPQLWPSVFCGGLSFQAIILTGAAFQWSQVASWVWYGGVVLFNLCVPIVLAAQQCLWHRWVHASSQPSWFAARYAFDWCARLVTVGSSGFVVDWVLQPLLPTLTLKWLADGPGRTLAVGLGMVGLCQLAILVWQAPRLLRGDSRSFSCA